MRGASAEDSTLTIAARLGAPDAGGRRPCLAASAEVAQRLSDRFQLLTGSRRRVPRQRTLEATLDWSHDHLSADEQRAFRRLAVFTGTFSLRAAEHVTGATADLIGMLVDKSLVSRGEDGRFRLLETVRAYAEDRLVGADEAEATRQAHVDWLLHELEAFTDEEVILATSGRSDEFVAAELENLYSRLAVARPLERSEIDRRLSGVRRKDAGVGAEVHAAAARALGLSKAIDLALDWLAMDEARSTVPDAPPALSSE